MKIYTSLSTHIDSVLPKLLKYNLNNLVFKLDPLYLADNSYDKIWETKIKPQDIGLQNTGKLDITITVEDSDYDVWSGHYDPDNSQINLFLSKGLIDSGKVLIKDILAFLIHELKHYYDHILNRKLNKREGEWEGEWEPGKGRPYDTSNKHLDNYFFHNIEFLPQVYSFAIMVHESIETPKLIDLFKYCLGNTNGPKKNFNKTLMGKLNKYGLSVSVRKMMYGQLIDICNYLKEPVDGDKQISNEEKAYKLKRVTSFISLVLKVTKKLDRYMKSGIGKKPFKPIFK